MRGGRGTSPPPFDGFSQNYGEVCDKMKYNGNPFTATTLKRIEENKNVCYKGNRQIRWH